MSQTPGANADQGVVPGIKEDKVCNKFIKFITNLYRRKIPNTNSGYKY
jgi:hypothetical protein